jgi:hypothetical protein
LLIWTPLGSGTHMSAFSLTSLFIPSAPLSTVSLPSRAAGDPCSGRPRAFDASLHHLPPYSSRRSCPCLSRLAAAKGPALELLNHHRQSTLPELLARDRRNTCPRATSLPPSCFAVDGPALELLARGRRNTCPRATSLPPSRFAADGPALELLARCRRSTRPQATLPSLSCFTADRLDSAGPDAREGEHHYEICACWEPAVGEEDGR